jgi:hypothetical protein
MQDKVVVRFLDRRIAKGITQNFHPHKRFIDLKDHNSNEVKRVELRELKAVYFVKSFKGNPSYNVNNNVSRPDLGKRIKICFKDGEIFYGYTQSFSQNSMGFLVVPADPDCNNEKIFVNRDAADSITLVSESETIEKDQKKDPDDHIIMICPTCGIKNKLKISQKALKPKCGKCKKDLVMLV